MCNQKQSTLFPDMRKSPENQGFFINCGWQDTIICKIRWHLKTLSIFMLVLHVCEDFIVTHCNNVCPFFATKKMIQYSPELHCSGDFFWWYATRNLNLMYLFLTREKPRNQTSVCLALIIYFAFLWKLVCPAILAHFLYWQRKVWFHLFLTQSRFHSQQYFIQLWFWKLSA